MTKIKIKNRSSRNFIINLGIYPFDIMISFGESDEALLKTLKKYGLENEDQSLWKFETDTVRGRACMFPGNQSLIRLRHYPKSPACFGELAHEIFHATEFILTKIGMKLKYGVSDEAYAYLVQFITTEIYKKL